MDPSPPRPMLVAVPRDAWGQTYQYRVVDAASGTYELSSAGPDATFGTEDDIRREGSAK